MEPKSKCNELVPGTHVEHKFEQGLLIVKMVHGQKVAVIDDATGEMKMHPISELFVLPGQDYNVLRRQVMEAADAVVRCYGDSLRKDSVLLALTRQLYAKDVRCGTDMIAHAQKKLRAAVVEGITEGAVKDMLQNAVVNKETEVGNRVTTLEPAAPRITVPMPPVWDGEVVVNGFSRQERMITEDDFLDVMKQAGIAVKGAVKQAAEEEDD